MKWKKTQAQRQRALKEKKPNIISNLVFVFALAVCALALISVIFPALMINISKELDPRLSAPTIDSGQLSVENLLSIAGNLIMANLPDPFELGILAIPVIAVNIGALCFAILWYKKKLPNAILNSLEFIRNFEVSRKVSLITIGIILAIYIPFAAENLGSFEGDEWADFYRIERVLDDYPFGNNGHPELQILHTKNVLLHLSQVVFQDVKVIPFIASIALALMTYFLTLKITGKRFAGLIAMVILIQSFSFLRYDTTATYANFWILLYVVSLYLLFTKRWYLSPAVFIISIFAKPLTVAFLPLTLFFIYRAKVPHKTKVYLGSIYVIMALLMVGTIISGFKISGIQVDSFDILEFLEGFTTVAYQLRYEVLILSFLLPVTVGLILLSRKGFPHIESVLILMLGALLSAPLLAAFTYYNIFPYRYLPFVMFFAVAVGTLFTTKIQSIGLKKV